MTQNPPQPTADDHPSPPDNDHRSTANLFAEAVSGLLPTKTTTELPDAGHVLDRLHPSRPVTRANAKEPAAAFGAWAEQQFADLHDPLFD